MVRAPIYSPIIDAYGQGRISPRDFRRLLSRALELDLEYRQYRPKESREEHEQRRGRLEQQVQDMITAVAA